MKRNSRSVREIDVFDPLEIKKMIETEIPNAHVNVRDLTGAFDHFEVEVSSDLFRGKSMIEQHRMIYKALGDAVGGPIHALKIVTRTENL